MKKRRRWDEELERELERKPTLAQLDEGKRASIVEELQRAGGNRAFQQLQREAAPQAPVAAVDERTYMYVDGIKGPLTDKAHAGAFDVITYELEMKAAVDKSNNSYPGHREYSDVVVVIKKSSALPALRQALVTNQKIEKILFTGLEQTTLKDVRVVGIKDLADGRVQLSFSFKSIEWTAGDQVFEDDRTKKS
jgi:type VI protein secretion system component Hcp